jgi:hypothetical protein
MKLRILIAAALMAVVAACSTVPTNDIVVTTDADPTVNFGGYQTYGWLASTGMLRDAEGRWTGPPFDIDTRIQYLVDQELGKRGITKNSANPELLLVYGIGIDMDNFDLKTDEATNELRLNNVPAGALMIVMVDDRTGALVWVGSATADIQEGADEETMEKRLDYAVSQMFKELPE